MELCTPGYAGKPGSFESMASVFGMLEENAAVDSTGDVHHTALGDRVGPDTIQVTSNLANRSFLALGVGERERGSFEDVETSEEVSVPCLDSLFPASVGSAETVRLKMDTQKCGPAVLGGSERVCERTDTVFLELSSVPLHGGELPPKR